MNTNKAISMILLNVGTILTCTSCFIIKIPVKIADKKLGKEAVSWSPTFAQYKAMPEVVNSGDTCIFIMDSELQKKAWQDFGYDIKEIEKIDNLYAGIIKKMNEAGEKDSTFHFDPYNLHYNAWGNKKHYSDGLQKNLHLNYNIDTLKVVYQEELIEVDPNAKKKYTISRGNLSVSVTDY